MSDFFAGINNIQMPQVVMNQGPLPGMGGLPAPLHENADARINYNSSLLGDITPYAYGQPGYLLSQTAYLNIPHRIQKVIPSLYLPEPADATNFRLCHPVDEGDIAFVMRLNRNSEVCTGMNNKSLQRAGLGTAVDPFINLVTLNYILAGLQICTLVPQLRHKWDTLMNHLDSSKFNGTADQKYDLNSIIHIVQNLVRPFGVVHGKDNQGGQSEATLSSVQWPVNFVTNMILDGKDAGIVNLWHNHDISAGDDLVLRLKIMPIPPGNKYTLNHYRKGIVEKTFTPGLMDAASAANSDDWADLFDKSSQDMDVAVRQRLEREGKDFHHGSFKITHVWQLVPEVFSFDLEKELSTSPDFLEGIDKLEMGLNKHFSRIGRIPWQHMGYWHIARTQVQSKKYGNCEYYYNDMAMNLRLGLIDSTFQPTFCLYPYRAEDLNACFLSMVAEFVTDKDTGKKNNKFMDLFVDIMLKRSVDRGNNQYKHCVVEKKGSTGMYSNAGSNQQSFLRLGHDLSSAPRESKRKAEVSQGLEAPEFESEPRLKAQRVPISASLLSSGSCHDSYGTKTATRTPLPANSMSYADSKVAASLASVREEDAGVFDEPARPTDASGGAISEEFRGAFSEAFNESLNEAVPAFTVAKPGLKSAKKPRGKGVVSSVLSADGSIRQEQSRML